MHLSEVWIAKAMDAYPVLLVVHRFQFQMDRERERERERERVATPSLCVCYYSV